MNKVRLFAASAAGIAMLSAGTLGVATAATTKPADGTKTIGSSGIPRDTFRDARLQATATVLNTSTDAVKAAHKDKTFKDLVSKAGLTHQTFEDKVKAQLTSDLKAKGYSQDQITQAMQHKHMHGFKHEHKKAAN